MRSRIIHPRTLFRIASSSAAATPQQPGPASRIANAAPGASGSALTSSSNQSTASRTHDAKHATLPQATAPSQRPMRSRLSLLRRANSRASNSRLGPQAFDFSQIVVPVQPPPHSKVSVGLQSLFSQGRPLLEYDNVLEPFGNMSGGPPLSASNTAAQIINGNGNSGVVGIAMLVPADAQQHDLPKILGSKESRGSSSTSLASAEVAIPEGLEAQIREKAAALIKQLTGLQKKLSEASPAEVRRMIKEARNNGSSLDAANDASALIPSDFNEVHSALLHSHSALSSGLSFRLHLPPLRSIPSSSFNELLDTVAGSSMGASSDVSSPLALHTRISTEQAFESARKDFVDAALERGEDTKVAEALGPEAELVIVGEPSGPKPEWARGTATHLSRFGKAFQPPPPPVAGEASAHPKRLSDLLEYSVQQTGLGDLSGAAATSAFEDAYEEGPTAGEAETEDVSLWLSHAMFQEKLKSQLEWDRIEAQMTGRKPPVDVRLLDAKIDWSSNTSKQASSPEVTIVTPGPGQGFSQAILDEVVDILKRRDVTGGDEEVKTVVVDMDSVKRKRRKKMRKMKYKKLRKRQRAERQRLRK